MIKGELIHLNVKNLKKWGVTDKATEQIIAGMRGIPIRACMNPDPHACDFASDNFANVGYVTDGREENGWIVAEAAITDREAAKKIDDATWMPFGKGDWSVTGFLSDPTQNFETSGLADGFAPDAIALIIGNGKPAFEGSGFERVAAAITNHRDDNMQDKSKDDGGDPGTYTQAALDAAIEGALEKQKTDDAAAAKKAADDEKAAYEEKIAAMTSKDDMKSILEAHGKEVEARVHDTIKRSGLIADYRNVMQKSPIAGAPFIQDKQFNQGLFDDRIAGFDGLQTAAIAGIVDDAKRVAAAVPGTDHNSLEYPATPPGSETSETQDMAAIEELRAATGRI
jgi:hypothetical protein